MTELFLVLGFIVLVAIGVPIAFSLGLVAFVGRY